MELSNTSVRWINMDSGAKLGGSSTIEPNSKGKFRQQFNGQFELMRNRQGNAESGKKLPPINMQLRPDVTHEEIKISSRSLLDEISAFNSAKTSNGVKASSAAVELQNAPLQGTPNGDPELSTDNLDLNSVPVEIKAPKDPRTLRSEVITTTEPNGSVALKDLAALRSEAIPTTEPNRSLAPKDPLALRSDTAISVDSQGAAQVTEQKKGKGSEQTPEGLGKINVATGLIANTLNRVNVKGAITSTETQPGRESTTNLASALALQNGLDLGARSKKTDATLKIPTQKLHLEGAPEATPAVKVVMVESAFTLSQWLQLKQTEKTQNHTVQGELSAVGGATERATQTPTLDSLNQARPARLEQDAQALSQRFAEQIGQRLVQQVQKGHWRAELELHPRSLGRIDVQLDFIDGRLEGHFHAHNQMTRDLLQDSLPRLREWLQQSGTQVANLDVSSGNAGQGGGKPTPHPLTSDQGSGSVRVVEETKEAETERLLSSKEGFDLLV
jgi:flagellar hook-length control protein FliK